MRIQKADEEFHVHKNTDERIELIGKPEIDKFDFDEASEKLTNKNSFK